MKAARSHVFFLLTAPINSKTTRQIQTPITKKKFDGKEQSKSESIDLKSQPVGELSFKDFSKSESDIKVLIASGNNQLMEELSKQFVSVNVDVLKETDGKRLISSAKWHKPAAILLDPFLPYMSGWSLAKQISQTPELANVPVWLVASDNRKIPEFGRQFVHGVIDLPIRKKQFDELLNVKPSHNAAEGKTILLVDDNKMHNMALQEFAAEVVDKCLTAETAKEAFQLLHHHSVDCIVLDLTLPDATGAGVLDKLSSDKKLSGIPVIIYSGKSLTKAEKSALMINASAIILKSVGSHSKLLNKISGLIGNSHSSKKQPEVLQDADLSGKTILIVEDDEKSFFSITSLLESYNLEIIRAVTGREALQHLHTHPEIEAVLMDIMMPDMDGLDALKEIRKENKWKQLPVISVTAKAMQGDREACLELGATDYVSKPINPDKLLTLLSLWTR